MRSTVLEYDISKVIELARAGKRVDGRGLEEMRDFSITLGKFENAEASAIVQLGETQVISGIKMLVDKPYPDNPDEGAISVGAELLPLAHGDYEYGPPSMNEIEVARVVDRGIRESKAIDFSKLCIKEGEAAFVAFFDFYAVNSDGNLFDAGSIAAVASFLNAKVPKLNAENKIIKGEYAGKIELKRIPLLTTFVKVGGRILVDPTYLEEKAAESRFSVATTDDGYMSAMQKGVGGSFTLEEVNYMIDTGFKVANETRKKLLKMM
jgi:exosome complex component RRP42